MHNREFTVNRCVKIFQSLNVAQALWQSRWYELPAKERRSVLLIMIASGKSLNMSAGKIFRMDFKGMGIVSANFFSYTYNKKNK